MQARTVRADALMLITAAIWGSAFVAQHAGMQTVGPFLYSGLRFSLATLALLIVSRFWQPAAAPNTQPLPYGGLLLGVVLAAACNLQQIGLLFTSITNSGFITGLYVIIVPLLGLFLGHRIGGGLWFGALLAVVGMFLLSSTDSGLQFSRGDLLQLLGAVLWAVHVLLVDKLVKRQNPLTLAIQQLAVCALISLALAFTLETNQWTGVMAAMPAVLYGGLCGVAIGYTLQLIAQRDAIPSHAAILFSLEAVFAAIAGAVMLGEVLRPQGYLGCALMLIGMLVAQLWRGTPAKEARQART